MTGLMQYDDMQDEKDVQCHPKKLATKALGNRQEIARVTRNDAIAVNEAGFAPSVQAGVVFNEANRVLHKSFMKKMHWLLCLTLAIIPLLGFANCDISCYRWQCEISLHMKPTRYAHSLVYCGNTPAYVTKRDYFRMARYQRADINMILTVNDEYIDSPCIPAHE